MTPNQIKPYWASVEEKEIADNMMEKVEGYYRFISSSGRLELYRRSYMYYYRARQTGARVNQAGTQGELMAISVNNFRNFLVHLETLTTQQRPAFEPKAINTDVKSQAQTILASNLLEYYMTQKRLERVINETVKTGLLFGEGFLSVGWDPSSGKEYGQTATGAVIYEGDLTYRSYMPLDVIRDFTATRQNDQAWCILREFQNKHDLAAKFPEMAEDILSVSLDSEDMIRVSSMNSSIDDDYDNIPVYTLVHKPTPALPQGRYTQIVSNRTVLVDGPLPYSEMHVYRLAPDDEQGSIFGFTPAFDLLPIQEAQDALYSAVITNQLTNAVQNIAMPIGCNINTSQLNGGLNVWEYDPKIGKPEAINLTATPPEVFNMISILDRVGETLSGVNGVARGQPEASLKSGAALALVQSMAVQFSQHLQRSYVQLLEDVGTATIDILKQFAAVPRVATIVGKSNRPLMREFTGEDLEGISRVTVDMGNALTRTLAGKVNLAETFIQQGYVDSPDQYMQVIATGRLEPVVQAKQSQNLLIKGENELLSEGVPQRVLATDDHSLHIAEHSVILNNPEVRDDPNSPVVIATLEHIQEHLNMMNDPKIAQLTAILHKEQAPQTGMPAAVTPAAQQLNPVQPGMQEAQGVNMPNAPQMPANTDPRSAEAIQQSAEMVNQNVGALPTGVPPALG
jgi:hypothetical protein